MLLLILVLIPFIFGFLCWQSERIHSAIPRWIALIASSIMLVLILFLYLFYQIDCFQSIFINVLEKNAFSSWKLEYIVSWIPRFGINFHLALDGLSLLMLMLSGILGVISILSSWKEINCYQGLFYFNLLWVLGGVIGFFLAVDLFLLFFFWEIILIPMFFLICIWGHEESTKIIRFDAASKFFIYAQISGLILLISIIVLACYHYKFSGVWSFDYENLLRIRLPKRIEYILMLGFFISFSIKMPIFPFHSWLASTHNYTPTAGSVDVIGFLLKTAVYGFFRFTLSLFPSATQSFSEIAMFLGLISIFYGSWMAFTQSDIKRLIAYTNISHMGLILIAIYSNNLISYQGAVIQIISYSLSASGMFILSGQLYKRLHTRNIQYMGGLWQHINLIPAFSLCFIAAFLGMPGTGNFIGEITILIGNFHKSPIVTVIAAFGILFTSIYSIMFMQRIYFGSSNIKNDVLLQDMTSCEKFTIVILLLCIFIIGFFPQFILNTSYDFMKNIHIRLQDYNFLL